MLMNSGNKYDTYLDENIEWEESSMTKALKVWANNDRHIRCVVDDSYYCYYHGQGMEIAITDKRQVTRGKWYIAKM